MDTIFALSTPEGRAAVAVVRISGPGSDAALNALGAEPPDTRKASVRKIRTSEGALLDEVLIIRFEEGASFTGEQSVEIHCHGSPAVVSTLLETLDAVPGLRMAEPGEFTRRAFENGRLSLVEVEGLGDLIAAETEAQRALALEVFGGHLAQQVEIWRSWIVRALALVEATIDFADEEVPEDVRPEVSELLDKAIIDLSAQVDGFQAAERVRSGFEVAIVGKPNVGKSTLLNRLAGRDAAITSEVAGTTRDVIEVRMDLGGLAVTLLDTAGIRETDDAVEGLGVERARERARSADLRIFLSDPGEDIDQSLHVDGDIARSAKGDLSPGAKGAISGLTGDGVSELVDEITENLRNKASRAGLASHVRQKTVIVKSLNALRDAKARNADPTSPIELLSSDLALAARSLDSLIGRVDVEHVLDEIFSSFCLGK